MPKPPKIVDHIDAEALPQGYDARKASGTMDENKHIHDGKIEMPGVSSESNAFKVPKTPVGPYSRDDGADEQSSERDG